LSVTSHKNNLYGDDALIKTLISKTAVGRRKPKTSYVRASSLTQPEA